MFIGIHIYTLEETPPLGVQRLKVGARGKGVQVHRLTPLGPFFGPSWASQEGRRGVPGALLGDLGGIFEQPLRS